MLRARESVSKHELRLLKSNKVVTFLIAYEELIGAIFPAERTTTKPMKKILAIQNCSARVGGDLTPRWRADTLFVDKTSIRYPGVAQQSIQTLSIVGHVVLAFRHDLVATMAPVCHSLPQDGTAVDLVRNDPSQPRGTETWAIHRTVFNGTRVPK